MILRVALLLFVGVPLIELYLLIEVGSGIGGLSTIALCLFTAALGGLLVRFQGLQTVFSARKQLASGYLPAAEGVHGMMIAVAGILLFLPGFVTDTIGFMLLIPGVRRLLMSMLFGSAARQHSARDNGVIDAEIVDKPPHHLP
ncbi:MAG: FxsA family protein [Mariprofundales bacterium]|nr:FxsA family protein [Mariprofundales bacterium]